MFILFSTQVISGWMGHQEQDLQLGVNERIFLFTSKWNMLQLLQLILI